ncbi:hypothetical protein TREMEDRAFT_45156 [Tremella mesenterica DSM 1558]|uniref:uncharacterized protein n=1 Tax=Tremella mesenterica (strain ATCC 24925 / CBS 8224 / DSM 1558 / NBRC 9311 / NRRL Y-6157 / RJB 2259-6 / UBC 559-6) TaxID=578456 RepID=UPI0003F49BC8|nr:uncharacterized protein TREMEDRAFT_45156 [Tremella mesenterica DSM 1558]EIW67626.1 hypothetical protein TREMEDRAFT_45156 [Tremella mesenterica DSM 1558]
MSRLPQISTPGRLGTPSTPGGGTGIPTPSHRRPRSSLGPQATPLQFTDDMDAALQEALRNRPPSSLKGKYGHHDDPDTPTQSGFLHPGNAGMPAPRTPGVKPKVSSSLGLGHAPTTPGASRSVSRPSISSRSSLSASTAGSHFITPRRPSMASSTTSATPHARRPESRASNAFDSIRFAPVIGDRVRMSGVGMEGTLRFLGPTQFKEGVWAGVELEGGFAGKGKNDGSVNGVEYFQCSPNCGMFVLASKLAPPTSGPSRPASVASSHHSMVSSTAYSLNGRATPSGRNSALGQRPATTTPGRATRSVSRPFKTMTVEEEMPQRTLLGNSTSSNLLNGKITAGSRAAKYVGMTAKQLDSARAGTLSASVRGLTASNVTPKASRVSGVGVTPARAGRQSLGGANMATPKARVPRGSTIGEMMPPPPSPSNITRVVQAHQVQLEEEIKELRRRNAELEEELRTFSGSADEQVAELRDAKEQAKEEALLAKEEADRVREEAMSLKAELAAAQAEGGSSAGVAEELRAAQVTMQEDLMAKEKELREMIKEIKLVEERAASELEAGMEAKRMEINRVQERAEAAEREGESMRALIEELTTAGQAAISLYEQKVSDAEEKNFELEAQIRQLEERLLKAREERDRALLPPSPSALAKQAATAAEIDNETLNAQVKHLQNRLHNLEGELEDARVQAETDADNWRAKLAKAKEGEKAVFEQLQVQKGEVTRLNKEAAVTKSRMGELEGALKENQVALEVLRAEVETLRGDATEAASLREALQDAAQTEKQLVSRTSELSALQDKLSSLEAAREDVLTLHQQTVAILEDKISTLERDLSAIKENGLPVDSRDGTRKGRLSNGSTEESKRIVGFQHIIQDLSTENADLKDKLQSLAEEVGMLKEEIKLLEETQESPQGGKELTDTKAIVLAHAQTIKDLHREVSELESLIESKIYREDELETRLIELEREAEQWRHKAPQTPPVPTPHHPTSPIIHTSQAADIPASSSGMSYMTHRTSVSDFSSEGGERCELCEGPHELDACPVFQGNLSAGGGSPKRKTKFCADCESTEHDTAECPLSEDVF